MVSPATPQLSVGTSSITTWVVSGFLPSRSTMSLVTALMSSAFFSGEAPGVILMLMNGIGPPVQNDEHELPRQARGVEAVHVREDDDAGPLLRDDQDVGAGPLLAAGVARRREARHRLHVEAEAVPGLLAVRGLLRGPHEVARGALDAAVGEQGLLVMGHVLRGGEEAAAGDLVARVDVRRGDDVAFLVLRIVARAQQVGLARVVDGGGGQAGGLEHALAHVIDEMQARGALDGAADQGEALGG